MGAIQSSNNKLFADYSKEDVAAAVSSLGAKYADYAGAICENGMDGAFLLSLASEDGKGDDGELFIETLDDLEVTNRLHRRKLQSEFVKAVNSANGASDAASVASFNRVLRDSLRESFHSTDMSQLSRRNSDDNDDNVSVGSALSMGSGYLSTGSNSDAASVLSLMEADNEKLRLSLEALAVQSVVVASSGAQGMQKLMTPPKDFGTIVLTDIEDSTALWEANPQAMRKALALHDQTMRRLMAENYGYEVTTEGDAFVICFHEAADALNFTLAMRHAMHTAKWEEDILQCLADLPIQLNAGAQNNNRRGVQVRASVHMGPLKSTKDACTGRVSYTGDAMTVCKSLEQCAHGGQIITSVETYEAAMATGALDSKTLIASLGTHAVKQKQESQAKRASMAGLMSASTTVGPDMLVEVLEVAPAGMTLMGKIRGSTTTTTTLKSGTTADIECAKSWGTLGAMLRGSNSRGQ